MPKILEDRVRALKNKGMATDQAYKIAISGLQKEDKLQKGSTKLVRGKK